MERVENIPEPENSESGKLLKILGVTFGIAVAIGERSVSESCGIRA